MELMAAPPIAAPPIAAPPIAASVVAVVVAVVTSSTPCVATDLLTRRVTVDLVRL
jgi:hypothetical protein